MTVMMIRQMNLENTFHGAVFRLPCKMFIFTYLFIVVYASDGRLFISKV